MAKRIEIAGSYFLMVDSVSNNTDIELPSSSIYYRDYESKIYFHKVEGNELMGYKQGYVLSDFLDPDGNAFGSYALLLTWLRNNVGKFSNVDVHIQDQYSSILVGEMSVVESETTLDSSVAIGDYTMDVIDATGIAAGKYISVYSVSDEEYYLGKVVSDTGAAQVETATVVATITVSGNLEVIVTGALVAGSPLSVPVAVVATDTQDDVAGKIRTALNIAAITDNYTVSGATDKVILTANAEAENDPTLNIDVHFTPCVGPVNDTTSADTTAGVADVAQVETATAVATITTADDIEVIVTGALVAGSPLAIPVTVAASDDQNDVAGKIRTAMNIAAITDNYTVSGATDQIILTADDPVPNDATLNIDIHFTPAVGLTDDTTSADTTAGVNGVQQVETATSAGACTDNGDLEMIVTGALVTGTPLTIPVAVLDGDDANAMATKIRAALNIAAITDNYTVSGATDQIILTADAEAANDATLNISIVNDTSIGYTDATTSANTTAGVAPVLQVETATVVVPSTITTAGAIDVIVTGGLVAGSPLTIPIEAAVADTADDVAGKIRTAMNIAAITDNYTLSGATDQVVLTTIADAANDATLNIDVHIRSDIGLTDATTSANTTAGAGVHQVETATVVGTCTTSGPLTVIITGADVAGSPLSKQVEVVATDTPSDIATKIVTAFSVAAITDNYTIATDGDDIVLTNLAGKTNDATLNIDYHITTTLGQTDATTSADTTAGDATITLDTPFDFAFPAGSNVTSGYTNMNVDGSSTPVVFGLRNTSTYIDNAYDITRIIFTCIADTAVSLAKFADLTALTRGVVLRKKSVDGTYENIFNLKTNKEVAGLLYDWTPYLATNPAQGTDGFVARLTFGGQSKLGVVMRLEPGDDIQLIVQDDLTDITELGITVEGHEVQYY